MTPFSAPAIPAAKAVARTEVSLNWTLGGARDDSRAEGITNGTRYRAEWGTVFRNRESDCGRVFSERLGILKS